MKLTGLRCRLCGCTEDNACVTEAGPCHWAATLGPDGPLCSACVTKLAARAAGDAAEIQLSPHDLEAAKNQGLVTMQMDFESAMGLLGAIQLACRHPGFRGSTRATVELIGQTLEARLSITPAWARIAASGWRKRS